MHELDAAKLDAARQAIGLIQPGERIGVGAGSTVWAFLQILADSGLPDVSLCAAAWHIEHRAQDLGLLVEPLAQGERLGLVIDGADRVDENGDAVKGRGGAAVGEKKLWEKSAKQLLIVTLDKLGPLGGCAVPVHIHPDADLLSTQEALISLGAQEIHLRPGINIDGPAWSQQGDLILDCHFAAVERGLQALIESLPGVTGSGLFCGYDPQIIVGTARD